MFFFFSNNKARQGRYTNEVPGAGRLAAASKEISVAILVTDAAQLTAIPRKGFDSGAGARSDSDRPTGPVKPRYLSLGLTRISNGAPYLHTTSAWLLYHSRYHGRVKIAK